MTSDTTTVLPMSEYEKFIFDLKGFLVIPGVLGADELHTVHARGVLDKGGVHVCGGRYRELLRQHHL